VLAHLNRLLVALLVLRVLAAPVAIRPVERGPHPHYGFTARICAWPPQRPQRLWSSWGVNRRAGSRGPAGFVNAVASHLGVLLRRCLTLGLKRLATQIARGLRTGPTTDRLRC
jgi:hypothetical protein